MFGGIGGFRLGLEQSSNRFRCVWYCEKDKYAVQTYNKNFKEEYEPVDITTINPSDLPEFDLVCGGFPCQPFSVNGKRQGFQDTRGTLFFEICKFIQKKKPRLLLLENVKGLLYHDSGRTFRTILLSLDELGYDVEWQVFNSKYFGVPQNRERVFIIGHLRGKCQKRIFPIRGESNGTLNLEYEVKGKTPSGLSRQSDRVYNMNGVCPTLTANFECCTPKIIVHSMYPRSGNPKQGGTGHLVKSDGYSFCLDTSKSSQVIQLENCIRRLTPVECERLQGFPDGWTCGVSDTQRYKQLGNAVTVNVISVIGERLLDVFEN